MCSLNTIDFNSLPYRRFLPTYLPWPRGGDVATVWNGPPPPPRHPRKMSGTRCSPGDSGIWDLAWAAVAVSTPTPTPRPDEGRRADLALPAGSQRVLAGASGCPLALVSPSPVWGASCASCTLRSVWKSLWVAGLERQARRGGSACEGGSGGPGARAAVQGRPPLPLPQLLPVSRTPGTVRFLLPGAHPAPPSAPAGRGRAGTGEGAPGRTAAWTDAQTRRGLRPVAPAGVVLATSGPQG